MKKLFPVICFVVAAVILSPAAFADSIIIGGEGDGGFDGTISTLYASYTYTDEGDSNKWISGGWQTSDGYAKAMGMDSMFQVLEHDGSTGDFDFSFDYLNGTEMFGILGQAYVFGFTSAPTDVLTMNMLSWWTTDYAAQGATELFVSDFLGETGEWDTVSTSFYIDSSFDYLVVAFENFQSPMGQPLDGIDNVSFGPAGGMGGAVPEPQTIFLLLIFLLGGSWRYLKKK